MMKKIKELLKIENIIKVVLIYVLIQPVLDILSFLNIRGYIPGISTILKPLFVFGLGAYLFLFDKKSRKKYFLIYALYAILLIFHNAILVDLMIERSVVLHEIRFMINFIYMVVLFMIFEYLYTNANDKEKFVSSLKKTIIITFVIYCLTIILAILTGTSAKTYEYADASKDGFKGWLDSGQIFGHALCIVFPFLIHYLFNKEVKSKILFILNKLVIIVPVIVLALIGTKVTFLLDIIILISHVVIDFIFAIKEKKKIYAFEAAFCLILAAGIILSYPVLPVKKNIDINNAVLSVDRTHDSKGIETKRKDLELMKKNIEGSGENQSYWEQKRIERLAKYYEWDLKSSEILEQKYEDGSLHPSNMRSRQLVYNFNKYKMSSLQYKIFGIGYLNQDEYLSLERDMLMILFSFGILGILTILIKPILIWIKACIKILKNLKNVSLDSLYLFEGFSIFFCISLYAGYTFIYTNFSIFLVIIAILLMDSLSKTKKILPKYFEKIYKNGREDFYNELEDNLKKSKKQFIITANPETIMVSEKDEQLQKAYFDNETTVIPDGVGIIKGADALNYDIKETVLGVDVAQKLIEFSDKHKKKMFLFGAKKEVLEKLREKIEKEYSNVKVVGTVDGYVEDKNSVFDEIKEKEPDVVLVALGIPAQEKLIYENLSKFKKGIFVGVGGSFDVLSGMKKRAPKIFIKLKLEWLYRILREPKRLKRFYNSNIKFLMKFDSEKDL